MTGPRGLADYYRPELGVFVQADGDSGDSAQRTATYAVLSALVRDPDHKLWETATEVLSVAPGRYRRTPDMSHWGHDPTCFSRDQHSIVNLAHAALGRKKDLKASCWELTKSFGFHQNFLRGSDDLERRWKFPDPINPTEVSVMIRGLGWWWLYPLLYILDVGFLVDLITRKRRTWDYDNMLAQNLFYAVSRYPTRVGVLAFELYEETDFRERLKLYYSLEENGIPPMAELYDWAWHNVRGKLWRSDWLLHWFSLD